MRYTTFGQYLTDKMEERNLTLQDVADLTRISYSILYQLRLKHRPLPRIDVLIKLSNFFGVSLHTLIEKFDIETPKESPSFEAHKIARLLSDEPDLKALVKKLSELPKQDLKAIATYVEVLKRNG